jgi:hypothetical protein
MTNGLTDNMVLVDMVYGLVQEPLRVAVKEMLYRGMTESMLRDMVGIAVDHGISDFNAEREKANAGH